MLCGTIDVRSELGKGTDISIRIPLSRVPGTETSVSTPSTEASVDGGSQDDSMHVLQTDYQATAVALYAFRSKAYKSAMTEAGRTLQSCIEAWVRRSFLKWSSLVGVKRTALEARGTLPSRQWPCTSTPDLE